MQQPPGYPPPGGGLPPGGGYGPPPGGGFGPPPGGGYGPPPGGGFGPPPGGGFGGPSYPGGYGPPAPPPPPPRKSGNGTVITLAAIIGVVVLGGSCATCLCLGARAAAKKEKDEGASTAEPVATSSKSAKPAPTAATNDNWITAERPYVKFLAPPGWSTTITNDKEWGIFKSPKKDAVLTFTTFNRPGESTVRLGKAAGVLGVTDIQWGTPRLTTVGKERFDAHSADGSCNFEGPGGYVWYATVNTGSSDQILLIFTVASNAPRARRQEAQAAIDSLQRR